MSYLNYILEANTALIFFYVMYWAMLRNENQFSVQRAVLLGGILFSLILPLVHLNHYSFATETIIPSIVERLPVYWLPEMVVSDRGENFIVATRTAPYWKITYGIYLIIGLTLAFLLTYRIIKLFSLPLNSMPYLYDGFKVYEVEGKNIAFSFLNAIYIGQGNWSEEEKEKILRHESIHLRQLHTLDILLVHIVKIIFWFNPIVYYYQKTLTHLHEYEADTKSVEPAKEDQFCLLLAKTALQSSGISLTHHFSNSITLKRITMIKTQKRKIRTWKLASTSLLIGIIFLIIGCQDQMMHEMKSSTLTQVGDYPAEVQADLNKFKIEFPGQTFSYIEGDKSDVTKLLDQDQKLQFVKKVYAFNNNGSDKVGIILSNVVQHANLLQSKAEVFTIVEHTATPKGGMPALYEYIASNLSYPAEARSAGVQGKVFVEFIVNENGSLSDFKIVKGIGGGCDEEALRVIASSPAWNAGMQGGKEVKQKMVIPLLFKLDNSGSSKGK